MSQIRLVFAFLLFILLSNICWSQINIDQSQLKESIANVIDCDISELDFVLRSDTDSYVGNILRYDQVLNGMTISNHGMIVVVNHSNEISYVNDFLYKRELKISNSIISNMDDARVTLESKVVADGDIEINDHYIELDEKEGKDINFVFRLFDKESKRDLLAKVSMTTGDVTYFTLSNDEQISLRTLKEENNDNVQIRSGDCPVNDDDGYNTKVFNRDPVSSTERIDYTLPSSMINGSYSLGWLDAEIDYFYDGSIEYLVSADNNFCYSDISIEYDIAFAYYGYKEMLNDLQSNPDYAVTLPIRFDVDRDSDAATSYVIPANEDVGTIGFGRGNTFTDTAADLFWVAFGYFEKLKVDNQYDIAINGSSKIGRGGIIYLAQSYLWDKLSVTDHVCNHYGGLSAFGGEERTDLIYDENNLDSQVLDNYWASLLMRIRTNEGVVSNALGRRKTDLLVLESFKLMTGNESYQVASLKLIEIANMLVEEGAFSILDACIVSAEIESDGLNLESCLGYNVIPISTFYDINGNGEKDDNDYNMSNIKLSVGPNTVYYSASESMGLLTDIDSNVEISFSQENNTNWSLTSAHETFNVDLNDINSPIPELQFGLQPSIPQVEIEGYIHADAYRCAESANVFYSVCNQGNVVAEELIVSVLLDENLGIVLDETEIPLLLPGNCQEWSVNVQVPGVETLPVGSFLENRITVNYTSTSDGSVGADSTTYNNIILCSYDPNDKLVQPFRENDEIYKEESLRYTVRFQNTGNAPAYQVEVRDTLDDKLDLNSFRVTGSSHLENLTTSLENSGELSFLFTEINLVDSMTNAEMSQGYISFEIFPQEDLEFNSVIRNTASIYFDFNPPIVTNTTNSILVDPFVSAYDPQIDLEYGISPNPATSFVLLDIDDISQYSIQIFNVNGQLMLSSKVASARIDISQLLDGIYFISLVSKNGNRKIKRIVVNRD